MVYIDNYFPQAFLEVPSGKGTSGEFIFRENLGGKLWEIRRDLKLKDKINNSSDWFFPAAFAEAKYNKPNS